MLATTPGRRLRQVAIALAAVVLIAAVGAAAAALVLQARIDAAIEQLEDPFDSIAERPITEPAQPADHAPLNVLVLGTDSRVSAGDASQWEYGAQRTDAIMLVHVAGDRSSAQVISIPRDSWVPIPGHGEAKINAAYSFGGPSLLIETVEDLTGVRIDHIVVADFESFATVTDDLGGVEMTLPNGLDSRGTQLDPGIHILTGEQALVYVRDRFSTPGGDFDRVQRQQAWMRAILRTVFERGVLTNPLELASFLQTTASAVAVDENLDMATMRSLAFSLRDLRPGDLTFLTAPVMGTGTSADGQSIVLLDEEPFDQLMTAVATDDVEAHLATDPALEILGASAP